MAYIGDYMSPECIFFGCKHDLKNLQEADGLLYIYFWHAYIGPRPMAS